MEETVCRLRGIHVGRQLSEGEYAIAGVARFDVARILESTDEPRSGSEQCSCLVAVRDDERTKR